jgi:DNA helicase-2/ATP-dependent DNA helicase PcrA
VRPEEILSLTFTKEGAREMTERAGLKKLDVKLFSTFHSWALRFIREEADALPFRVRRDWHNLPNPLCLPLEAARTLAQIVRKIPGIDWKDAAGYISLMKRRGISPHEAAEQAEHDKEELYAIAYRKYEDALRDRGMMDFDSIVIETAKMLERRKDITERHQFRFIQVDEAQDTDAVQWRVVKMLSAKHGNVLAVGDENQGMYSWRGSESNLTAYFCGIWPEATVMPLPVNYRSTGAIVNYCKEIAPIQNETVTNLSTVHEHGIEPVFRLYKLECEEATAVINGATDLGNTAVLARTNRQLAAFEKEFGERGMRYKLLGKSGFWGQREVKDVMAIVGAVVFPTDANILHTLTARCELTKFIRKTGSKDHPSTIDQLKQLQSMKVDGPDGKVPLNRLLRQFPDDTVRNVAGQIEVLRCETASLPGGLAMQRLLGRFGVMSVYDEVDDEEEGSNFDNDPRENIQELVKYAQAKGSLREFYDYVQRIQKARLARTNCITLSTIHQAKGKEWDTVFVVGVNDEVLPHKKGDPEEEKRIYFVACSRAAKRLQVSANGIPSAFIAQRVDTDDDPWAGFMLHS